MSVLSSKRSVSHVEFLKVLSELQTDVMKWATSQSPKYKDFGIKKLYDYVENAFALSYEANNNYPNAVEVIEYRIERFKRAIVLLHGFNAQITTVNNVIKISNKKTKRWCNYSERAIKLLNGIIRSDKAKLQKLKEEIENDELE